MAIKLLAGENRRYDAGTSTIWLEGGPGSGLYLGLGTAAALGLLFLSGWVLLGLSVRLPIRKLFAFSSILMILLAFILGGKAAHSFQEAAWLPSTPSFLYLRWDWLGLYPTLEVQAVQAAVLTLGILLWFLGKRPVN